MRFVSTLSGLRLLTLFLSCFSGIRSVMPAAAANTLFLDQISAAEGQDSQDAAPQSPSNLPTEAQPKTQPKSQPKSQPKDVSERKDESDHHKKNPNDNGSFVIAPLPIVSPALGTGIIPILGYITPIPAKHRGFAPSVMGAGGLITNDGSRGFGVGADLYLDKARYEVESIYAHGNIDYNLYGEGFISGNAGLKLPLEQAGHLFFFKTLRRIGWDFYAGIRFVD